MQAPETTVARGPGLVRAVGLARAGLVTEALTALDALRQDPTLETTGPDTALLLSTTLDCRLARGDLGEALAIGDELTPHLAQPGTVGALAHHAHAELASVIGESEPALAHLETAGLLVAGLPEDPELLPWRAAAALALLRLGRRREGATLAREHLDVARAAQSPYAVAQALRTLATTDAAGDRVVLLREARAALAGCSAARLAAQIDTDLAGLLLLSGDAHRAEVLRLLRSAEDYAGRQELLPLQGRARRLLERLGEAPRRVLSEALAALTAAERRVAVLAAQGMTNRQVAQHLGVTVKAVEWHLSHVYRKLGIGSRTRLAATLGCR